MVNFEHKLTVDDLVVEYMIYKVKNGYNPSFTESEFREFLEYFQVNMPGMELKIEEPLSFDIYYPLMTKRLWSFNNWKTNTVDIKPHIDLVYNQKMAEYEMRANYKLSDYDTSIINTYYMDGGMSRIPSHKGNAYKIRKIIEKFLKDKPKRSLNNSIDISKEAISLGKNVTTKIVIDIWYDYINKQIENRLWPSQCTDINKYLFEYDLAVIIGLPSIKSKITEMYKTLAKRIAVLYSEDDKLNISTDHGSYLAGANYNLLIKGYESMMTSVYNPYNKNLRIDLANIKNEKTVEDRIKVMKLMEKDIKEKSN